ncbi:MAG TPA: tetratricopeptide repeat protein [Caulobacteraceae bacterium]|nr:tetratricopeptide repeat protein [Caulobacteraceae bacterium]
MISRFEHNASQLWRLVAVGMIAGLCTLAAPRAGWAQAAQTAGPPAAIAPPGPVDTPRQRREQAASDLKAGRAAFDAHHWPEATQYLVRASQYDPDNPDMVYWVGRAYLEENYTQQAIDHFNLLLTMDPRSDRAYYARAKAEIRLGQYAAAIGDFNKYLEINKGEQNDVFYNARGDAYLDNGENDLALRDFNRAIALNSGSAAAYLHRGVAYARTANYPQAMADFAMADRLGRAANTLTSDNFFFRGLTEDLMGEKQAAATDFKYTQVYNDYRKDAARCLGAIAGGGLFSRIGCSGVDATKELNKPVAY